MPLAKDSITYTFQSLGFLLNWQRLLVVQRVLYQYLQEPIWWLSLAISRKRILSACMLLLHSLHPVATKYVNRKVNSYNKNKNKNLKLIMIASSGRMHALILMKNTVYQAIT